MELSRCAVTSSAVVSCRFSAFSFTAVLHFGASLPCSNFIKDWGTLRLQKSAQLHVHRDFAIRPLLPQYHSVTGRGTNSWKICRGPFPGRLSSWSYQISWAKLTLDHVLIVGFLLFQHACLRGAVPPQKTRPSGGKKLKRHRFIKMISSFKDNEISLSYTGVFALWLYRKNKGIESLGNSEVHGFSYGQIFIRINSTIAPCVHWRSVSFYRKTIPLARCVCQGTELLQQHLIFLPRDFKASGRRWRQKPSMGPSLPKEALFSHVPSQSS